MRDVSEGPELVARLRQLELADLEQNAAYRCCVCGDVVPKRTKLAFFAERAGRGEEKNLSLQTYFNTGEHVGLLQPQYHQINNLKNDMRKELSESVAVMLALEVMMPGFDGSWQVVDLCCGRSLTAALLSLRYKGIAISGVDTRGPEFMPHFNQVQDCQVCFHQLDVLADTFVGELEHILAETGRPAVLVGMHLCGHLSTRAIEVFKRIDAVHALVLSPCCLPKKDESLAHIYDSKDNTEQYQQWALHLQTLLHDVVPAEGVTRESVADMLTPKNVVICAKKPSAECAQSCISSRTQGAKPLAQT